MTSDLSFMSQNLWNLDPAEEITRLCCVAKRALNGMGLETASIEDLSGFSWNEINTIMHSLNLIVEKNKATMKDDEVEMPYSFDSDSSFGGLPEYLIKRLKPRDVAFLGVLIEVDGHAIDVASVARILIANRA